jgi:hypothetical protein
VKLQDFSYIHQLSRHFLNCCGIDRLWPDYPIKSDQQIKDHPLVARWALYLVMLLIALLQNAMASSPVQIETVPSFGLHLPEGRYTEVKVTLHSSQALEGTLQLSDANGITIYPLQLDEGALVTKWLATRPAPNIEISVYVGKHKLVSQSLRFDFDARATALISDSVPVSNPLLSQLKSPSMKPIIITASALPHRRQSYDSIAALITNADTLSYLDTDQYSALAGFIAGCGSVVIQSLDEQIFHQLQALAGCQARQLRSFLPHQNIATQLPALLSKKPASLPTTDDLLTLTDESEKKQLVMAISIFFSTYLVLMLVATKLTKNTYYWIWLPVLYGLGSWLLWNGPAQHQKISWTENESGDPFSRSSQLILAGGARNGEYQIPVSADSRIYLSGAVKAKPRIESSPKKSIAILTGHSQLFSNTSFRLEQTGETTAPITLTLQQDRPHLEVNGITLPPNSRLIWHGASHALPDSKNLMTWQLESSRGSTLKTAAEKLLNRRLNFNEPAILLPQISRQNNKSWHIIRLSGAQI